MTDLDMHVSKWVNIIIMLNEKCNVQNDTCTGSHLYKVQKTVIPYTICEHTHNILTCMGSIDTNYRLQGTSEERGESNVIREAGVQRGQQLHPEHFISYKKGKTLAFINFGLESWVVSILIFILFCLK